MLPTGNDAHGCAGTRFYFGNPGKRPQVPLGRRSRRGDVVSLQFLAASGASILQMRRLHLSFQLSRRRRRTSLPRRRGAALLKDAFPNAPHHFSGGNQLLWLTLDHLNPVVVLTMSDRK